MLMVLAAIPVGNAVAGYSKGGNFSAPGYGARAWGMGGAAVAGGADEGAAYWNPALLSRLPAARLGFSYVNLVPGGDAQLSYLAYARVLREGPADDVGLEYALHAAGLIYQNLSLDLSDGQGYSEHALRLAYALSPDFFLSFGIGLNLLVARSDLSSFDAMGTSVDAGLRVMMLENLSLGFVARNVASRIMFDDSGDQGLQRSFTVALSTDVKDVLRLEADAVAAFGGLARFVLGGELTVFSNVLAVRGAVSVITAGENRTLPHLGIGIHVNRLSVDYNANFDEDTAFENTHRFSLGVRL
jgi:hypothetical protein